MTKEEKIETYIKENFEPVDNKPGYVLFGKRDFQIISIETLRKALSGSPQIIDEYFKIKGE